MTIEIKFFNSLEDAKIEKKKMTKKNFRPLHTDFVDGKIKVTFVNGDDDPANSDEQKALDVKFQRISELDSKLQDDSLTFPELKERMRLKGI